MELSWEKWLVMAALAIISILFGVIPLIVFHGRNKLFPNSSRSDSSSLSSSLPYNIILTVLACFGGGVLLATSVVHMLTEARANLAEIAIVTEHLEEDFPLAEILALVGFALIYLVEEIAHAILAEGDGHHHHHPPHPVVRHNSSVHSITLSTSVRKTSRISSSARPETIDEIISVKDLKAAKESTFEEDDHDHSIGTAVRSLLALIALSFHAIMEGIAIGIQEEASLWFMFGAVASHKFVISFCMGMELFATKAKLSTYLGSVIFFGVISPVGIFVGTLISSSDSNALPIAIIKGLSTGTLVYVVFFEILNRERAKKESGVFQHLSKPAGFIQFTSLVIGMAAMTLLITLTAHNHGHEHDHLESSTEGHDHDHPHVQNNELIPPLLMKTLII